MSDKALLALADGTLFYGKSVGWAGSVCAEVVFNTAMTGYQEILTDPSYAEQMVLLTYPHIGNTGINSEDMESESPFAKGLIIRDLALRSSNWRETENLSDYLNRHKIVGISEIDTRQLTKHLVHHGAQMGCIQTGQIDPAQAVQQAKKAPSLVGRDLASEVTCAQAHAWTAGCPMLLDTPAARPVPGKARHIVVVDFGVKHMMLRLLVDRGCRVTVVPAQSTMSDIMGLQPDGVLLSNGPGDPAACGYAIDMVKALIETDTPILGICLGFQILALAAGAKSFKMEFGHHGANHPVQECATGKVFITSQNHGFAVDEVSLTNVNSSFEITHRSLFDKTVQGIQHKSKKIFGFQGHPEASPGPHDLLMIFDRFVACSASQHQNNESVNHA